MICFLSVVKPDHFSTLFLIAGIQYVYVMYLGFAALPFVARSELLLSPLLPIFGGSVHILLDE